MAHIVTCIYCKKKFDSKYYQELLEELGLTKYNIYENTILDAKNFVDLLFDYIKIKEKNLVFKNN